MERNCSMHENNADALRAFLNNDAETDISMPISESGEDFVRILKVKETTTFNHQPYISVYASAFSRRESCIQNYSFLGVWGRGFIHTKDYSYVLGLKLEYSSFKSLFKLFDGFQESQNFFEIVEMAELRFPDAMLLSDDEKANISSDIQKNAQQRIICGDDTDEMGKKDLVKAFKDYCNKSFFTLGDELFEPAILWLDTKIEFLMKKEPLIKSLLHKRAVCLHAIADQKQNLPALIAAAREIYQSVKEAGKKVTITAELGGKEFHFKLNKSELLRGNHTYYLYNAQPAAVRNEMEKISGNLPADMIKEITFRKKILYCKS